RRRVLGVRALPLGVDGQPARRGRVDVRRAALLLDHHLERGGGERRRAHDPQAAVAVRSLPGLHARRHRHTRRELPGALRARVPLSRPPGARLAALARVSLMRVGRSARGWSQLALEVILIVAAGVLLQILAERTNRRIDLTPTRALSLS